MSKKAIFIGATGQNVGKTTLCLGLIAALKKRFSKVGFMKPVGQMHVTVKNKYTVDKDAYLFKEHFHIKGNYDEISPVIIPSGFTKDFIDGKVSENDLLKKICASYEKILSQNTYTVVEGTGHIGVGSIINLNNARIAAELGLDMVIITTGGLGSAFDELALNISLCHHYGVPVRGVILNRVYDSKREMILDYFTRRIKEWDIPLLGCIPFSEDLSTPCMRDFETLFNTKLLSGEKFRFRHYHHARLAAGSVESFYKDLIPGELIITPASRTDIILAAIASHDDAKKTKSDKAPGGLILTGRYEPSKEILTHISTSNLPILYAAKESYEAMKQITSLITKTPIKDITKIKQTIKLIAPNVDIDTLCGSAYISKKRSFFKTVMNLIGR